MGNNTVDVTGELERDAGLEGSACTSNDKAGSMLTVVVGCRSANTATSCQDAQHAFA